MRTYSTAAGEDFCIFFFSVQPEQLVENASSKRVYSILESFRLPKMAEQLRGM